MHLSPGAVHAGPDNPRRWDGSRYRANPMLHHKCQIVNPFYGWRNLRNVQFAVLGPVGAGRTMNLQNSGRK